MNLSLLTALAGAGMATGVLLAIAGWQPAQPRRRGRRSPTLDRRRALTLMIGVTVGVAGWMATGWMVSIAIGPIAALGLPYLLGGGREAARAIARLEAIEEWVRLLATRLTAGITVEQALASNADHAPEEIRPAVQRLAARLRSGSSTQAALRHLADELDSSVGDLVVAQLHMAAQHRGHGVAASLTTLSDLVAEEVSSHRAIEADRAKPRLTARLVTLLAVGAGIALAVFGDFMDPYATGLGQVVLAVIVTAFGGAMVWMRRMTSPPPPVRFLTDTAPGGN
ncbi:type II secretion system F family protein [Nocardiopsis sp. NPDC006139]|uniref:type II secretion system F family protein n=1 Tax=Nocardiopsis sp. NPDC006139 TaxID=3154578 RepID=UPI0033AF5BDA